MFLKRDWLSWQFMFLKEILAELAVYVHKKDIGQIVGLPHLCSKEIVRGGSLQFMFQIRDWPSWQTTAYVPEKRLDELANYSLCSGKEIGRVGYSALQSVLVHHN